MSDPQIENVNETTLLMEDDKKTTQIVSQNEDGKLNYKYLTNNLCCRIPRRRVQDY